MTICNVVRTMKISKNTAVIVEGPREIFRNGIGVLDDKGNPFEVLSVSIDNVADPEENETKTSLLLSGRFSSKKMYV